MESALSLLLYYGVRTDFGSQIQDFFQNSNFFFQTKVYQIGDQQTTYITQEQSFFSLCTVEIE